jgi:hypothetical protein
MHLVEKEVRVFGQMQLQGEARRLDDDSIPHSAGQ